MLKTLVDKTYKNIPGYEFLRIKFREVQLGIASAVTRDYHEQNLNDFSEEMQ